MQASYLPITRTAPGWEERTVTLLLPEARTGDGSGPGVPLRPGFARLALLLDVTGFGGGEGLTVRVQHSPDGSRWYDIAAFQPAAGVESQVAWLEAQPALSGVVCPPGQLLLAAGTVHPGFVMPLLRARWEAGGPLTHAFGVDVVAIYPRSPEARR